MVTADALFGTPVPPAHAGVPCPRNIDSAEPSLVPGSPYYSQQLLTENMFCI
ncbi:hypothetical protein HmCmsJML007_03674 [Escherichia coli]|nr:hypothetical protein HmCmsJML007_03674 [Escherichia coli]